jgi:hypothetical protein
MTSANSLGYCHECDRQVEIDMASFACSVCNGGFIEMFEIEPGRAGGASSASAASNPTATNQPGEARVFRFDANSADNMEVRFKN